MRIAYCDCFSGVSGDMFLAALVDAGLSLDHLKTQLLALDLPELLDVQFEEVHKGALRAGRVKVCVAQDDGAAQAHAHRHWTDIAGLIDHSALTTSVKSKSVSVFKCLAQAEATVHGTKLEEVHFHEVGAADSIADIVGAAIGLDYLEIEQLYASPLPLGAGQVDTQHGPMPLPAPATLELMRCAHVPVLPSPAQSELVTPTGAAILAALARF